MTLDRPPSSIVSPFFFFILKTAMQSQCSVYPWTIKTVAYWLFLVGVPKVRKTDYGISDTKVRKTGVQAPS